LLLGYGVYSEVERALESKKEVFVLRKFLNNFYLKRVKNIWIIDSTDWKVCYGKIG
jgi:hypothetical protein